MADDSMRSLNSFGVAGLLSTECEIYYSNDLRGRNVGRVSDLISAKLRSQSVDELRIRALIGYGVFGTYAIRKLEHKHAEEVPAASLEVGVDASHVAVAIAFHWDNGSVPKWGGLSERLESGAPVDEFEHVVEWLRRHSTQLIVRYEIKERRIELVSLLNRHDAELRDPVVVVAVDSRLAPLLEVSTYVELGDLNYSKLLKNPIAEGLKTTKGGPEETEIRVISGAAAERAIERRFKGETDASDEIEELKSVVSEYEQTVSNLRATVQELEEKLGALPEKRLTTRRPSPSEESQKDSGWGFNLLKQALSFATGDASEGEEVRVVKGEPLESGQTESVHVRASAAPSESEATVKIEGAAGEILAEIAELSQADKHGKIQETLAEISEEVEPDKARRWVDNLSSELLQEKAKLSELQKNLAKQMRQRELEFKTAERTFQQELARKEEALRQKQTALDGKSEQISQLNLAVERATTGSTDKEQQQFKSKLDRAQRVAQLKDEEVKVLVMKVRDLENRLIIAQAKAQKGTDLQMQTKIQTLDKKVEEYKRVNQRLMESLNQHKDKSTDKEMGELRRRLDQIERQANDSKRNLDKANFKLREAQESERKLQADLARAIEENRNLRKAQNRGGTESGGGQAA